MISNTTAWMAFDGALSLPATSQRCSNLKTSQTIRHNCHAMQAHLNWFLNHNVLKKLSHQNHENFIMEHLKAVNMDANFEEFVLIFNGKND
jgi:hypothetical protein